MKESSKKKKWEINDEENYVGNFFGWGISKAGALLLLFMIALIVYRYCSLPDNWREEWRQQQLEQKEANQ